MKPNTFSGLLLGTAFLIISIFSACRKESQSSTSPASSCDCQTDASCRKGAVCNDGTTTTATGSGACSGHGGVDYWQCQ